ncbi:MAG: HAD family hydrolase [Myxococcota bacterium]|nr:HAD family hydrolase [Myxococcota bacterium]
MSATSIKGVIFDLDGTLYTLKRSHLKMALALWRDIGLLRQVSAVRSQLRDRTFTDKHAFKKAFFAALGRRAGVAEGVAALWYEERFMACFIRMLKKHARLRPGLPELLSLLRDRGVKLAVLSDYGCVPERLAAIGIGEAMFDDVFAAEEFGTLKPSRLPLDAIAQKWGVEQEALIVVGDRQDLDQDSARLAGMEFLGIRDGMGPREPIDGFVDWQDAIAVLSDRSRAGTARHGGSSPQESSEQADGV